MLTVPLRECTELYPSASDVLQNAIAALASFAPRVPPQSERQPRWASLRSL